MLKMVTAAVAAAGFAVALSGAALAQSGPVATVCAKDIAKYCAHTRHGNAQTRRCLEGHRKKVSAACRNALDATGGGRGRNRM